MSMLRKAMSAAVVGAMLLPALPLAAQDASSSSSASSAESSSTSSSSASSESSSSAPDASSSSSLSSSSSSSVDSERGLSTAVRRRNASCSALRGLAKASCLREAMHIIQDQWSTRERGVRQMDVNETNAREETKMRKRAMREALRDSRRSVRTRAKSAKRRSLEFWKLQQDDSKNETESDGE